MPLTRDLGKMLQSQQEYVIITCSTADLGTTGVTALSQYVGYASTTLSGRTIDRLGADLGRRYRTAEITAYAWTSVGSTEADQKMTLLVGLQHGASSGAGDMANFSSGDWPATRTFFTSALTTPMHCWSTAGLVGATAPGLVDITGAKRFIRTVIVPTHNNASTVSTTGHELMHVAGIIRFGGADELPDLANTTGTQTTSTSTST